MLKFPADHYLFMSIGSLAGFAVLVADGANLGVVAHQLAQLVDAVGHVLTPKNCVTTCGGSPPAR